MLSSSVRFRVANLLIDSGIVINERLSDLCQEADELAAIFVASVKTVKKRN